MNTSSRTNNAQRVSKTTELADQLFDKWGDHHDASKPHRPTLVLTPDECAYVGTWLTENYDNSPGPKCTFTVEMQGDTIFIDAVPA